MVNQGNGGERTGGGGEGRKNKYKEVEERSSRTNKIRRENEVEKRREIIREKRRWSGIRRLKNKEMY